MARDDLGDARQPGRRHVLVVEQHRIGAVAPVDHERRGRPRQPDARRGAGRLVAEGCDRLARAAQAVGDDRARAGAFGEAQFERALACGIDEVAGAGLQPEQQAVRHRGRDVSSVAEQRHAQRLQIERRDGLREQIAERPDRRERAGSHGRRRGVDGAGHGRAEQRDVAGQQPGGRRRHLGAERVVEQHDRRARVASFDGQGQAGGDAVGTYAKGVGIGAEVVVEERREARLVGAAKGAEHHHRVGGGGLHVDRGRLHHEAGIAGGADRRAGANQVTAHRGAVAGGHGAHVAAPRVDAGHVGGIGPQIEQDLGALDGAIERQAAIERGEVEDAGLRFEAVARHGNHDREGQARGGARGRHERGLQDRRAIQGLVKAQARQRRRLRAGHARHQREQAREQPACAAPGSVVIGQRVGPCLALPAALRVCGDADRTRQALDLDEQLGPAQRRAYHLDAAGARKVCAHELDDLGSRLRAWTVDADLVVAGEQRSHVAIDRRQRTPLGRGDQAGEVQQRLLRLARKVVVVRRIFADDAGRAAHEQHRVIAVGGEQGGARKAGRQWSEAA